jgi:aryl-alcohol dehydrogenase-like predicted oxidoreductase
LLSGKYRIGEEPPSASRMAHAPNLYSGYLNEESFAAIDRLKQSAEARGVTIANAALRFVLDSPGVDSLIIAPRSLEQFANLGFEPQ